MSVGTDGLYRGTARPQQPLGFPKGWVLHHMMDWAELRELWNTLVRLRLRDPLSRYLGIIGYPSPAAREMLVEALLEGQIGRAPLGDQQELAERICWQCYNLFQGPTADFRRPHAADPARMLNLPGATTFDFPVVAPPHGERANTLWRAFGHMRAFLRAAAAPQPPLAELDRALALLTEIQGLDIIPVYEVNWFAVSKQRFWGMSPVQRERFFEECMRDGLREADADAVYERIFGPV